MNKSRLLAVLIFALVVPITIACAHERVGKPLPEVSGKVMEYPSVTAALQALHARPDVLFSTESGWTIATDEAHYTIWSFAPRGYPAYPAVAKRYVVPQKSGSIVKMNVYCEASKDACDDLVRTFSRMAPRRKSNGM